MGSLPVHEAVMEGTSSDGEASNCMGTDDDKSPFASNNDGSIIEPASYLHNRALETIAESRRKKSMSSIDEIQQEKQEFLNDWEGSVVDKKYIMDPKMGFATLFLHATLYYIFLQKRYDLGLS
jgi:hypothetical protein